MPLDVATKKLFSIIERSVMNFSGPRRVVMAADAFEGSKCLELTSRIPIIEMFMWSNGGPMASPIADPNDISCSESQKMQRFTEHTSMARIRRCLNSVHPSRVQEQVVMDEL